MQAIEPANGHIFISDLHLSGSDERSNTGPIFARLLDHLCRRAEEESRAWRLVLLGDVLDFLRTETDSHIPSARRLDTSESATLAKLERIAAAHPDFFAGLNRFAAAGNSVVVVPGNHDLEIYWPSVQRRLATLVAGGEDPSAAVVFSPWLYFIPGVLYAEHGHQYHDINSSPTLLHPFRPDDPGQVALPLGSHLELCLSAGRSPARRLCQCAGPTLADLAGRFGESQRTRRARYQTEMLPAYAAAVGMPYETVAELDRYSETLSGAILRRLPRLAFARLGLMRAQASYLRRAARRVDGILRDSGVAVPYYVFGHTHHPAKLPLAPSSSSAYYLNCSSSDEYLAFVEVGHDPASRTPYARLGKWQLR